jgi:hypothetical protein
MKAGAFFEMTVKVRAAQKTYYTKGRLQGDLIIAKQLESQLDKAIEAVKKDGGLEPDALSQSLRHLLSEEEYQEYLRLINQNQLELQLDLSGSQRPTDGEGEQQT